MEFLPNGSVVRLNVESDVDMDFVIVGRLLQNPKNNDIMDYLGVVYPFGFVSEKSFVGFNHSQILEVLHEGYNDKRNEQISEILKQKREVIVEND